MGYMSPIDGSLVVHEADSLLVWELKLDVFTFTSLAMKTFPLISIMYMYIYVAGLDHLAAQQVASSRRVFDVNSPSENH